MNPNDIMHITVAYDGDCPFCKSYIYLSHLRSNDIQCDLIDLRESPDMVQDLRDKGLEPNDGLYVQVNHTDEYHGDEAMMMITLLTNENKIMNRFFKWMFANKKRAKAIYPILRAGRYVTLKLLGRKAI